MTLPDSPWRILRDVSRTSRAFSPKIALVCRGAYGDDLPPLDPLARIDDGLLGDAGSLVRTTELEELVRPKRPVALPDRDLVGRDLLHHAGLVGQHHVARVHRRTEL